jgi:GH15 family glucan-1,4-alpha-glucosidase
MRSEPYQPIENYAIIGNLQTVALVGMHGSIDFLSFPYFDSPTVFAALLDHEKGGHFQIVPLLAQAKQKQLYLLDSNILLTRFLAAEGVAEISDFMPVSVRPAGAGEQDIPTRLVRRAKTVRGEIRFRIVCAPRFHYGQTLHKVDQTSEREIIFSEEGDGTLILRLRSLDVPLRHENGNAVAEFTLRAGETAAFVLEEVRPGEAAGCDSREAVAASFKETMNFWHGWLARSTYHGRWREMVNRSALTLKLLTSQRYGSIVAAPTFGLPESIGHGRNWDYRYTWIRDSSFTLYALNRLGYNDEAAAFMRWVETRCGEMEPDKGLQLMYGIDGRHQLDEYVLANFEGYRGSRPVRVGNAAYSQLQLDIYGELMDAVYLFNKYGRPIDYDGWQDVTRLVDYVCANYRQPDAGIWEVRGGQQEFLYSRLMCWVAVDRGIRLAQRRSFPTPPERWFRTRDDIYRQIFTDFWDPQKKIFVQALGRNVPDAASLLMPLVRFISPTDRRWLSTLRAIERDLVEDSLVYRYRDEDGLDGAEGTFCMCSFWYVECLARSGDLEQARFVFEKMLGYANHVGLYSEELGTSGEHLGNFPQAFTHLGLISAAYNLNRLLDDPQALT